MTAHDHAEFVEGCYRCDLSRDEVRVTAREFLAEQKRLAAATSEGPWDAYRPSEAYRVYELSSSNPQGLNETFAEVSGYNASADAEFIAASRTTVPRLIAALEAVLAMFPEVGIPCPGPEHCNALGCDIRRAIEAALSTGRSE